MTHHGLAQAKSALERLSRLRRELQLRHGVEPVSKLLDRVGQAAPAPRLHVDDLAATAGDERLHAVSRRRDAILVQLGCEDHHQLIVTHLHPPFCGLALVSISGPGARLGGPRAERWWLRSRTTQVRENSG